MKKSTKTKDGSFSFQVDINIPSANRDAALKRLVQMLNDSGITDYRIDGMEAKQSAVQPNLLELRIRLFIENSKLIRININKGRGVKMSIPCRVLNYDSDTQLITVYHVDEKQVYTVGINEIDDFVE
ncbi:hypothetical protein [Cohnella terricola]|uniref:Uncharacterized protein n=1 Tax=Cohnella terricola TaxID=1289167 RepID=A0A559JBV6_9BACL|nr:hypothetical protein [Cohnella terricola]TVX97362.1 hypothetical protein FPZ45_18685 [Cohnella terricola]